MGALPSHTFFLLAVQLWKSKKEISISFAANTSGLHYSVCKMVLLSFEETKTKNQQYQHISPQLEISSIKHYSDFQVLSEENNFCGINRACLKISAEIKYLHP